MISKKELIEIWKKYYHTERPEQYKTLFTENGFMRFVEGYFITKEERDDLLKYTKSVYSADSRYAADEWTYEYITDVIKIDVKKILDGISKRHYYSDSVDIIKGWLTILGVEIEHIVKEEYPKYYNNTEYGYFNMPYILDIIEHFNWMEEFKPYFDIITGFEVADYMFDFKYWKNMFPNSKQITMLKNSYDKGWTKDDFVWDENGYYDSDKNKMEWYNSKTNKYVKNPNGHEYEDQYFYYTRTGLEAMGIKTTGLRKVDSGAGYLEELIHDKGDLLIFYGKYPIYRLRTNLGNFYMFGNGYWSPYVFCENTKIKKISFGSKKAKNLEIDKEERDFVLYNKETGYWRLPKLHYPTTYKNFIMDILKKQSKTIGPWSSTCVYANSRTLCGDRYSFNFNLGNYPDIKDSREFANIVMSKMLEKEKQRICKTFSAFKNINIDVKVTGSVYDDIKLLDCITQEDVNEYCIPETSNYDVEFYK